MRKKPKIVVICTTPRSGSTHLCNLLLQTGNIGCCIEILEWVDGMRLNIFPHIAYKNHEDVLADFEGYVEDIVKTFGSGKTHVAFKIHMYQLTRWRKWGIWPLKIIRPDFYVFLERRNTLLQTISLGLAHQTQAFTAEKKIQNEPIYNKEELLSWEYFVRRNRLYWKLYFLFNRIRPTHVFYESLNKNLLPTLEHLLIELGVESNVPVNEIAPEIEKQRTKLNYEWLKLYRKDRMSIGVLVILFKKLMARLIPSIEKKNEP